MSRGKFFYQCVQAQFFYKRKELVVRNYSWMNKFSNVSINIYFAVICGSVFRVDDGGGKDASASMPLASFDKRDFMTI